MAAIGQTQVIRNLGKYALLENLGEGPLGTVYKALDPSLSRPVALRVLPDAIRWDADLEARFHRECQAIARMQHPNIAAVFDFGRAGLSPYMAMEFLSNQNLAGLIAQKSAPTVERKLSIMIQVADGLSHAHSRGILHRCLKPAKIHLAPEGSIKIRDVGTAHVFKRFFTRPGIPWGDPLYVPPEEIQRAEYDQRSDVFSAGVVFYELLTGRHLFRNQDSNNAGDRILCDSDIPPIDQFPDLPPGIWPILERCLARDPQDRYQAASELSNACRNLMREMTEDSQLMLAELQAALPRLRRAAARPGASPGTITLCQEIQDLSGSKGRPDYASLDRLMAALADQYPIMQAISGEPELEPLYSPRSPEEPALAVAAPVQPASPSTGRADRRQPQEAAEASGTGGDNSPRASNRAPGGGGSNVSEHVAPVKPQHTRRNSPQPSFRLAAVLLSILLIVTAVYVARVTVAAASLQPAWSAYLPSPPAGAGLSGRQVPPGRARGFPATSEGQFLPREASQFAVRVLLEEAKVLASQGRPYESRVLIQRVLEISPGNESAVALLEEIGTETGSPEARSEAARGLKTELARVSSLIRSGKLQPAKAELDRLQSAYPGVPEILALRKRWEAKNSLATREQARKADEDGRSVLQRKEEDWTRRVTDLYARGNYSEARGALTLWLSDDSASPRAHDLWNRIEAVQRNVQTCESALAEGKYQDALNALSLVQQLNPTDPNLAELRRRIDSRQVAARATLTVRRLGDKATLLLDGRQVGEDGEIHNESIGIGSHTIGIESAGGSHASKAQEFVEGQSVTYVYDTASQVLRPMTDADGKLIAQREIKEEPHRFNVEHNHGVLRGGCKGTLSFNYFETEFKSDSGWHGFLMPFKQLMLKTDGRSLDFFLSSNGKYLHTFRVQNAQEAEKFRQAWQKLEALKR